MAAQERVPGPAELSIRVRGEEAVEDRSELAGAGGPAQFREAFGGDHVVDGEGLVVLFSVHIADAHLDFIVLEPVHLHTSRVKVPPSDLQADIVG